LRESADVFLKLINLFPDHPKLSGIQEVLAGVYFDLGEFNSSLEFFKRANQLAEHTELSSLGIYLSLVELGEYDSAIKEMSKYLETYPANLYKDTLVELLGDLENGYATAYRDTIITLARKNGITPDE
jgi:tetratricopeptide (TPR) repeat protein